MLRGHNCLWASLNPSCIAVITSTLRDNNIESPRLHCSFLQVATYEVLAVHSPSHYVVFLNVPVFQSVGGVQQFVKVICTFMPIHATNFGKEHLA